MRLGIGRLSLQHYTEVKKMTDKVRCDDCPELMSKVNQIHAALISGLDGKPGLMERVRALEIFKTTVSGVTKTLVLLTLTNISALAIQLVMHFVKG